jgi:hypothetical protein
MNNEEISALCDWLDEWHAENTISPGYINDPIDTDKQECFV